MNEHGTNAELELDVETAEQEAVFDKVMMEQLSLSLDTTAYHQDGNGVQRNHKSIITPHHRMAPADGVRRNVNANTTGYCVAAPQRTHEATDGGSVHGTNNNGHQPLSDITTAHVNTKGDSDPNEEHSSSKAMATTKAASGGKEKRSQEKAATARSKDKEQDHPHPHQHQTKKKRSAKEVGPTPLPPVESGSSGVRHKRKEAHHATAPKLASAIVAHHQQTKKESTKDREHRH